MDLDLVQQMKGRGSSDSWGCVAKSAWRFSSMSRIPNLGVSFVYLSLKMTGIRVLLGFLLNTSDFLALNRTFLIL